MISEPNGTCPGVLTTNPEPRGRSPQLPNQTQGVAAPFEFRERCQDCAWDVSYSDTIVWFKLIAGLYDAEIKEDILSLEEKSLDNTEGFPPVHLPSFPNFPQFAVLCGILDQVDAEVHILQPTVLDYWV